MNGTEDWFLINSPLCEVSSSSGVYNPDRDLGEQQHSHTSPITIQSTQTNAVTVELVFVKWDDL